MICNNLFVFKVKEKTLLTPKTAWISLDFSSLGFIGKLFDSLLLENLVAYTMIFYKDKPIDWIYYAFVTDKVNQKCRG